MICYHPDHLKLCLKTLDARRKYVNYRIVKHENTIW